MSSRAQRRGNAFEESRPGWSNASWFVWCIAVPALVWCAVLLLSAWDAAPQQIALYTEETMDVRALSELLFGFTTTSLAAWLVAALLARRAVAPALERPRWGMGDKFSACFFYGLGFGPAAWCIALILALAWGWISPLGALPPAMAWPAVVAACVAGMLLMMWVSPKASVKPRAATTAEGAA